MIYYLDIMGTVGPGGEGTNSFEITIIKGQQTASFYDSELIFYDSELISKILKVSSTLLQSFPYSA